MNWRNQTVKTQEAGEECDNYTFAFIWGYWNKIKLGIWNWVWQVVEDYKGSYRTEMVWKIKRKNDDRVFELKYNWGLQEKYHKLVGVIIEENMEKVIKGEGAECTAVMWDSFQLVEEVYPKYVKLEIRRKVTSEWKIIDQDHVE